MARISNGDTGDVRGLQRHTEAVADVEVAGGARIDKSTTPAIEAADGTSKALST